MTDLRQYQVKAVEEIEQHRRPLLVAPTGSGKTVIATAYIERAVAACPDHGSRRARR
jgi:superfamily II DNA or RNA helicase